MNYLDIYRHKVVTVEEALTRINSRDEVVCGVAACEPMTLLAQLHTIKGRVSGVSVFTGMLEGQYEFFINPAYKGHFHLNSWMYTAGPRAAHPHGTVSYIPVQVHQMASLRFFYRRPNVFLGCATPMDKHGYLSLSLSTVIEKDSLEQADVVILEVNPRLPRTHGDTQVHISQVDLVVETDREIPTAPPASLDDKDRQIGAYVADLVEDGATIQLGIGSIPGAVAVSLKGKRDLGVHSGIITDSFLDLYEAGAITNRRKTLWKGKFVTGMALGTQRLYDFLDDNPAVEFQRGSIVNNPAVIAQNHRMVTINTVMQMDLTGQCSAESIGPRQFSGTGGHKEWLTGALEAAGGRSILAFHSTTKNDAASRIVPQLAAGTVVTSPRVDVDYVVTEYGVACLRGRSIRERVGELISIAHPNFRDYLKSEAERQQIW